jgi:pantothenate kinase type III
VALKRPPHATGKNTIHSMQSGLIFGFAGLVEGLVRRLRAEWGDQARVVATGGLAGLIARETDVIEVVEANVTHTNAKYTLRGGYSFGLGPGGGMTLNARRVVTS